MVLWHPDIIEAKRRMVAAIEGFEASRPPVTYDLRPLITSSSPSTRAQVGRGASAGSVNANPVRLSPASSGSRWVVRKGSPTPSSTPASSPKSPRSDPTPWLARVSRTTSIVSAGVSRTWVSV
jgi:hypothetical protein